MPSFPVFNVTSHPLDCVLDSGHWQVWQRTLVAVESRLPARKNAHQSLGRKNTRNREGSFYWKLKTVLISFQWYYFSPRHKSITLFLPIQKTEFDMMKIKKFKMTLTTQTFVVVDIFPCGSNIQRWYERSCLRHRRMVKISKSHSMVLKITADNNTLHWVLIDWLEMRGADR